MAFSIPIQQLTRNAFGLNDFSEIEDFDLSKLGFNATGTDSLGRPYFMDVVLTSDLIGEKYRLPNEPLVRVSKSKTIVETIIAGNEENTGGVVLEQINKGNYAIDIRGIIMNEEYTTPQYPQDQVKKLIEFAESGEALGIECDFLEVLFGIRKIIIIDYEIDAMQGQPYSQRYTLNCKSYQDFYATRKLKSLI